MPFQRKRNSEKNADFLALKSKNTHFRSSSSSYEKEQIMDDYIQNAEFDLTTSFTHVANGELGISEDDDSIAEDGLYEALMLQKDEIDYDSVDFDYDDRSGDESSDFGSSHSSTENIQDSLGNTHLYDLKEEEAYIRKDFTGDVSDWNTKSAKTESDLNFDEMVNGIYDGVLSRSFESSTSGEGTRKQMKALRRAFKQRDDRELQSHSFNEKNNLKTKLAIKSKSSEDLVPQK